MQFSYTGYIMLLMSIADSISVLGLKNLDKAEH
jgi:hypothetical protein